MKNVSMICPSRNNLKYLKWNYESVRNLYHDVEFCVFSDYSTDGTVDWCEKTSKTDKNFKYIVNDGTWFGERLNCDLDRMGHTLGYDKLILEVATREIVMIWHADMAALPNMLENMDKHMKPHSVVSATRIEPPLHPPGPEKHIVDCGIETEEYNEKLALETNEKLQKEHKGETTNGIFAPWMIYKRDFLAIMGHDPLFAPQSKEDSDIFNRFVLNQYELVQAMDSFCYHMTCRGSRFADGATRNPDGKVFMKNRETDEWLTQNLKSTRNFIRKWGTMVKHDEYLHPIITPKYDIALVVKNCDSQLLVALEPWCSKIYVDLPWKVMDDYITIEQPNTKYNLRKRVNVIQDMYNEFGDWKNDIIVTFDAKKINETNINMIAQLPEIITDSGEIGEFDVDIFEVQINSMKTYERDLISAVYKKGLLR